MRTGMMTQVGLWVETGIRTGIMTRTRTRTWLRKGRGVKHKQGNDEIHRPQQEKTWTKTRERSMIITKAKSWA